MATKKPTHNHETEREAFVKGAANIINTPLEEEVSKSYLEYAYSVIHSRALPDARDGLKPVHRRILYSMITSGYTPDHSHVKCARIVGTTLGTYHPHGDSSVYEAMVRMAQDFSLNVPLVDGHGNFGSPNDGPASMRYTEARLAKNAMHLVNELNENTVNYVPNYDGSLQEPTVLPAAFPNLVVNGTSGIAVGMATNMIPHNASEVIEATRALLKNPKISLDELMEFIPGPDLPTGGVLIGLDEVRNAYEGGRGTVRIRATTEVGPIEGSRGRQAIIVTELPYQVGTEKIIESIKSEIGKKRLQGISDVKDLSDRRNGTRLVIECKTGVNPQALLADLYKHTPLETSFGINNLALVKGTPKTLGLKALLEVFIAHRQEVVLRRTQYRLDKAEARKHIVEGLLIVMDNTEEVVRTIRASKDTADAKASLMKKFKLSEIQTQHILDMALRRLVNLEILALKKEHAELVKKIKEFNAILNDRKVLLKLMDSEFANVLDNMSAPRRTTLIGGDLKEVLAATAPAGPLEIKDEPCRIMLSTSGLLARTTAESEENTDNVKHRKRGRSKHDLLRSHVDTTTRGVFIAITNKGRGFRVGVLSLPPIQARPGVVNIAGGVPDKELLPLTHGEHIISVVPHEKTSEIDRGVALGTRDGVIKICVPEWPARADEFEVIQLKGDDEVVGAFWCNDKDDMVFITDTASLLHFPAQKVRPQGRSGGGMAGIKLPNGVHVVAFNVVNLENKPSVITFTGKTIKRTPLNEYPSKGRATAGVRAHKFLKGEEHLLGAFIGNDPVASDRLGKATEIPTTIGKRDGSGIPVEVEELVFGELQIV